MNSTDALNSSTVSDSTTSRSTSAKQAELETSDYRKVYLSVVWYGACLGAAYYETDTCFVHLLLDTRESSKFEQLEKLVEELSPVAIVTSAKQDERFISKLREIIESSSDNTSEDETQESQPNACFSPQCVLDMLPSCDYRYETSMRRLFEVRLPMIPEDCEDVHKAMILSSIIPFDCGATVRATGGLIRYLSKKRVSIGLESPDVQTPISAFQTFTLKHAVYVDKVSSDALQIFKRVCHPSAFKIGSRESLSLFVILNRTNTFLGRKLMKSWFYRPTSDRGTLARRLNAISFLVQPRHEEICITFKDCLRHVKNISRMMAKVQTCQNHSVNNWTGLHKTALSALRIADACRGIMASYESDKVPIIFKDVVETFTQDLVEVVSLISETMDDVESKIEGKFIVKPGVSENLDRKKGLFAKIPAVLCEVANREVKTFKEYISSCQILYMRRVGYLLYTTKAEIKDPNGGLDIPGLELVADSNETIFYKSRATKLLDQEFGDVLGDIADEEEEIESRMREKISNHSGTLLDVMRLTAEIDCILAFTTVAKEQCLVRPKFIDSKEIHILGGRHLLQEQTVSMFVPNDVHFGPNDGLIKILTGPNASGKSVYLKQVGLIVFMAYIGCFVPAESAEIGQISRIFTVTRGKESICSGVSSFASDLGQMSTAAREAGNGSLVLIDEFGKGTATVDGVALLSSFLRHWTEKDEDTPLVLCATHFHSLVRQSLLPAHNAIKYVTMDTMQDEETAQTVYLYKLVEGVSKCSQAGHVARLAGVPGDIITRGQEVSELFRRNMPVRRYNSVSTVTYQKKCQKVAEETCRTQLDETNETKRLLAYAQRMLTSPKRRSRTNFASDTSSMSSEPESRSRLLGSKFCSSSTLT